MNLRLIFRLPKTVTRLTKARIGRITDYLWSRCQKEARTREDFECWSITLRLMQLIRQDAKPSLDHASMLAVGKSWDGWKKASAERTAARERELAACIPDYDPETARALLLTQNRLRRSTPQGREVYPMQPETLPRVPQLMPDLPQDSERQNA